MDNKSVGFVLREARIARQISLEQASKDTKIHLNILKNIEADDISSLGAVYAKSFLRIYSEYLGLDKQDVVSRAENLQPPVKAAPGRHAQLAADAGKKRMILAQTFVNTLRKINFRQVVILLAVIFLLIGFIRLAKRRKIEPAAAKKAVLVKQDVKKSSDVPKPVVQKRTSGDTAAAAKPVVQEIPKSAVVPKPKTDTVEVKEKIVLTIKAKSKNWLQVKMDGKVVFQGILAKGSSETWSAKDKFELWVGDAGALALEFNGQILDRIGRPGQTLKHVVLTRSGLSIKR